MYNKYKRCGMELCNAQTKSAVEQKSLRDIYSNHGETFDSIS